MTKSSTKNRTARPWLGALNTRYDALMVANGTPPSKELFLALRRRCGTLIALDGGVNILRRWRIAPHHVIGDLDSASSAALRWVRAGGAEVHPRPSQESADFEKGLSLCRKLRLKHVLIMAADGDALDHVMNGLSAASLAPRLQITLITERVVARVLRGRVRGIVRVPKWHTISWFGCPSAGPSTLKGVVWPFADRWLEFGGFNSLSNLPDKGSVTLRQAAGVSLFVVSLRPKARRSLILSD